MTNQEFSAKLAQASSPFLLAQLTEEMIEDSFGKEDDVPALEAFLEQISLLLDAGLDPNVVVDEVSCIWELQYGYTRYHLDAAKRIFDRCGLPTVLDDDMCTFFGYIRSKLDYNYYNCEYLVKLYLLCCAYTAEETGLQFSPNLYAKMFDPLGDFTSVREGDVPLHLTPEIFKDIHRFDFSVEMLPQEKNCYGCWRLHIFEKESKIEVAAYG